MTTCVRHVHVNFAVAEEDTNINGVSSKVYFWEIKLKEVTIFCLCKDWKGFLLFPGKVETSLVSI